MAHIDRVREEAIQRIMFTFDMGREDAESIVDHNECRLFDLGDEFDVDISEQVTRMILPVDEQEDE